MLKQYPRDKYSDDALGMRLFNELINCSSPHGARVSGVVEETPGRLEYEVALYREATGNVSDSAGSQTVDQAVPIGTKLQLRARISPDSAWGYIKLLEVTVSPDPDQPHAPGSVILVKDGCRNRDFASIIPHQPARYRERKNEVFLDFEAFLLSSMRERSTLWIHSQIKACMEPQDCQPVRNNMRRTHWIVYKRIVSSKVLVPINECIELHGISGKKKSGRGEKEEERKTEKANFDER